MRAVLTRLAGAVRAQPLSARVVLVASFVAYWLLSTLQWRRFESRSWDLGIFAQALDRYSRLEPPIVHIKGGDFNLLGDHFHPLLAALAPFYGLFPTPYTLLVAQSVLLALSAFFVAKAAHEALGTEGGWLIGIAHAFSWGVLSAVVAQFHEVALAAPLLALSLWLVLRERWTAAALWAGLLVFVKEDLGLTVIALGVVIVLRSRRWWPGAALAGWGAAWFILALAVILPALSPGSAYEYSDQMDIRAALTDPLRTVTGILTSEPRMGTLLLVLACTAFTLLRSSVALAAVPTLAWRFLSSNELHWGTTWHYSLVLMPVIFIAAADGIARLRSSRSGFLRAYGQHGAAVVLAFTLATLNQYPLWSLTKPATWQVGARQQAARAVLDAVPDGVSVASDSSLVSYLVPGRDAYFVGLPGNPVVDYLVVDQVDGGWSGAIDAATYGPALYPGTTWTTVLSAEGYQVARRVG